MTTRDDSIIISMVGELNGITVPGFSKNNRKLIKRHSEIVFDLSQITSSDNSGVGLLVALTSYAKKLGKRISFVHLPSQLLGLVEAVKLKDVLPIS
ncbi:MAG: STAS domain-containing protein [Gammaproteobacteria bacterium]|nr:STAS domain-containing protein [Gammaproteobacteria bacterium]